MVRRLQRMDRGVLTGVGLALAIVCFLAVNLFSSLTLSSLRLDLTADRLYTLSPGTKVLLAGMKEPVVLRLYLSDRLADARPDLRSYVGRVKEMLAAYVDLAEGRIALEVVDPEPFSPEEDRAAGFGLSDVPYSAAGDRGYFGLVGTNTTDDTDVIAFLEPAREAFLEYDLTRLIYNLANPDKPVVAFIDGLAMSGGPQNGFRPWQVLTQIKQFFDVRTLGGDVAKIDDDVSALLVVHPHALSDKTQFAIDQFVLRGGPTLVFLDPHAETMARQAQMGGPPPSTASKLERLLKAWGVEMTADTVVGDAEASTRVQAMSGGRAVVTEYLPWLSLDETYLAAGDVVTGQLDTLRIFSVGALKAAEGATTTLEPLIQSSAAAMPIDVAKIQFMPDPVQLIDEFKATGERYVLAARVTGPAKTGFPDGAPKAEASGEEPAADAGEEDAAVAPEADAAPTLKESSQPISVIVVADTDLLADDAWLSTQDLLGTRIGIPFADNADFAINALENLAGGQALAGLRGRGISYRPFTTVDRIQQEAESKYRATERQLTEELEATRKKLSSFEVQTDSGGNVLLTPEQQETIRKFKGEMLEIRGKLREVQHALRRDIERLQTNVMLADIGLMPVIVALVAIGLALWRRSRAARSRYQTGSERA